MPTPAQSTPAGHDDVSGWGGRSALAPVGRASTSAKRHRAARAAPIRRGDMPHLFDTVRVATCSRRGYLRRMGMIRLTRRIAVVGAIVTALYFLVTFAQVWQASRSAGGDRADAIVVL